MTISLVLILLTGLLVFNIGSITKTFTTLLLADMVKQGIVNLNDPIKKFLPSNVSVPQFNGHKITLEDLATHTSEPGSRLFLQSSLMPLQFP